MSSTLRSLAASFPDDVESVASARLAVGNFAARAGMSGSQLDDVRLCVSEAVANAVAHGYPNGELGDVRVGAAALDGKLLVHVSDDGCGLQGESPNSGLGLGVPLMRKLSDGLVVRENAGVEVHLRFNL
jgi:stage II sporulation protein AB (anti-sigma F factor)